MADDAGEKKMGRPTKYTKALGNRICDLIACGETLRSVAKLPGMPDRSTILRWAMDYKHDFYDRYERARELQVHALVDDMKDIADDGANDYMEKLNDEGEVSGYVVNHENINRSKLRLQYREWVAERVLRRVYGNKVDHEVTGKDGKEIKIRWARPEELEAADREMAAGGG